MARANDPKARSCSAFTVSTIQPRNVDLRHIPSGLAFFDLINEERYLFPRSQVKGESCRSHFGGSEVDRHCLNSLNIELSLHEDSQRITSSLLLQSQLFNLIASGQQERTYDCY
jgi:hypothetical protein